MQLISAVESAQRRSEKIHTFEDISKLYMHAEAAPQALHFEKVVRDIERSPTEAKTPPPMF
jgi:hypothetical protein